MHLTIVALLLAFGGVRQARAECPWTEVHSTFTTSRTLTINEQTFTVAGRKVYETGGTLTSVGAVSVYEAGVKTKGERNWIAVYAMLQECKEPMAAEDVRRWRANQRLMNWSWIGVPYSLPLTIYAAIRVHHFRNDLEHELRD